MIFKIKKEERLFALMACVVFVAFNALLIYNKYDRFTMGEHVGFWSVFYNHLNMSGYDVFSCIAVSCLRIHFSTLRHPLYIVLLLPIYWLNSWIMKMTGFNCAIFFIAAINIFCATYSALFMLRTLHELVGLSRRDAFLLTAMLYSFAHVLIATMVPDHFCLSLFLLTLTLYIAGRKLKEDKEMSPLLAGTLFFLTAGVTLTNGVKTAISLLYTNGRKAFAWRNVAMFAVAAALLGGIVVWQNEAIVEPQSRKIKKIENSLKKKDPNFGNKFKAHDEWVKRQNGKAMTEDVPLLKWSDMSTSRIQSLGSNLFGESIQLHRDHLLEDLRQCAQLRSGGRGDTSFRHRHLLRTPLTAADDGSVVVRLRPAHPHHLRIRHQRGVYHDRPLGLCHTAGRGLHAARRITARGHGGARGCGSAHPGAVDIQRRTDCGLPYIISGVWTIHRERQTERE